MKYKDFVKKCAVMVKEKFTPDQEIEIWNFLVEQVDNNPQSELLETDGEDIDPLEELIIDVMHEAFPE